MRILFWGTPPFALPSLRALAGEGHEIAGIVTRPDRPAGRGRQLQPSSVKLHALEEGYPVFTPPEPKGEEFLERLSDLRPEVSVVVAYGHILRRPVLDVPDHGSINVHASLLPLLRGAAPVTWAIARGHERTGVTVMRMVEAMDAGPILHQLDEPIGPRETASELTVRLSELGAEALIETLALMEAGVLEETEQDESRATYAPKVDRETAHIDWSADPRSVSDWIRAMDRVPGAWSRLDDEPVKIFQPIPREDHAHDSEPGRILVADPEKGLTVATDGGAVEVGEVQPAGKRRMAVEAWLRGRGAREGQRFE